MREPILPTEEQQAIRDAADLGLLILAPAGSGKTEALALRLAGLLARGEVQAPRRALVLTFSNRAKDNVRERLRLHLSRTQLARSVSVTNLHGFAARVIRAHGSTIGVDQSWQLPVSDWTAEQCDERGFDYPTKDRVKSDLQRVKRTANSDEEVAEALKAAGNTEAAAVEEHRLSCKQLTYEDLLRLAERALNVEAIARLYREHFAVVLVDEFQDLTPQQLRIINAVGFQRTTYAGDLAQGIYGFAGAAPREVVASIRREVGRELSLTKSHRSSPAVLALVNALEPLTGGTSIECADPTIWPHGGFAASLTLSSCETEAENVVKFAKYVLENAPEHKIGVLSRIDSRRRFLDRAFEREDLPTHRWDDPMMDPSVAAVVDRSLELDELAGSAPGTPAYQRLASLGGVESIDEPDTRRAIVDGLAWASDLLAQAISFRDIRSRIKIGNAEALLNKPGVHLLNAHVGKGQQFDWVAIIGAEDGNIPFFKSAEDLEEARVLSVMLSRARHGILLTRASTVQTLGGSLRNPKPSPFLAMFADVPELLDSQRASEWLKQADWSALRDDPRSSSSDLRA